MVVKKAKANPMRNITAQIRSTTIAAYFHSPSFRSLFSEMIKHFQVQWGWGITGQRITGQSCPDWLKMTSSRTSKPYSSGLSRF